MIATIFLLIWKLVLPALIIIAVIDWLTASDARRIKILHRAGMSQRRIAGKLNLTRYRVSRALAT
jgi:IS30 family transposase